MVSKEEYWGPTVKNFKLEQNRARRTEQAFYKTVSSPTRGGIQKRVGLLATERYAGEQSIRDEARNARTKSLPKIKNLGNSASQLGAVPPRHSESGIGKIYKGIFSPNVGRILGSLAKKKSEILQKSEAFITDRVGEDSYSGTQRAPKFNAALTELMSTYYPKTERNSQPTPAQIRTATAKLVDDVLSHGSHSQRSQFIRYVESGDQKHLFYCDFCPHCRVLHDDVYSIQKRLKQAPDINSCFFEFLNYNKALCGLKEFSDKINSGKLTQDATLFNHFVEQLVDKQIDVSDILDVDALESLQQSYLYRGITLEQDCKNFIAALDSSVASCISYKPSSSFNEIATKTYKKHFEIFLEKSGVPRLKSRSLRSASSSRSRSSMSCNTSRIESQKAKYHIQELHEKTTFGKYYQKHLAPPKKEEEKFQTEKHSEAYSTVLFIAFQEILRQICGKNKEKGFLLLKVLRLMLEESERKWLGVVNQLTQYSILLKHDIEFLLGRFFSKPDEVSRVLENSELTAENLAEHKRLLQIAVGAYFSQESQKVETETKVKLLEEEIKKLIVDWEEIKKAPVLLERLKKVDSIISRETQAAMHTEFRRASRAEKALLINAQRFFMALPYKNKWEMDKEQVEFELQRLSEQYSVLQTNHQNLEYQLRGEQNNTLNLTKEIERLTNELAYAWNKLNIPKVSFVETQTEINMQDLYCIEELTKISEEKHSKKKTIVQKLIDRVNRGMIEGGEKSKQEEIYSLICWIFTYLNQVRILELKHVSVHTILFQILTKKHKEEAKQECIKLMRGMKELSHSDERVNFVCEMLGFNDKAEMLPHYMMAFYVAMITPTGLHMDEVFGEKISIRMPLTRAFNFYVKVFGAIAKRQDYLRSKLLLVHQATLSLNEEVVTNLSEKEILRYFYIHDIEEGLTQVHKKSLRVIFDEFSRGREALTPSQLEQLLIRYSTTPLDPDSARAAIAILFPVENKTAYTFDDLDKLFYWRIHFEVPLRKYLSVGIKVAKHIAEETRSKLNRVFENYDKDEDQMLRYIEFVQVLEDRKRKKAKWEVLALYDEAKSKDGMVHYEDFLYNLLINPALKNFFDDD